MSDQTGVADRIDMRAIERIARQERAEAFARVAGMVGSRLRPLTARLTAPLRRHAAYLRMCREMTLLDARCLRDIGITREDIPAIAARAALQEVPRYTWRERAELARQAEDVAAPAITGGRGVRHPANDQGVPQVPLARRRVA